MVKKNKCDFCKNISAVTVEGRNLCAKHYFHKLNEVDIPFGPKSRRENHWSVLLRELRSEAGMTQRDLARKTRMSQRTIADYENMSYPRQLSIYKVERLLKELGYDLDAVLAKKNV